MSLGISTNFRRMINELCNGGTSFMGNSPKFPSSEVLGCRLFKVCSRENCSKKAIIKGLCHNHYEQSRSKLPNVVATRKKWESRTKDHRRETHRLWKLNNKEKRDRSNAAYRKRNRTKISSRYRLDINHRIASKLRARLCMALKSKRVRKRKVYRNSFTALSVQLLGCSIDELKKYIEDRWLEGMSWDNYTYRGWHIDHIIACAKFELSDPIQLQQCFHFTNLQPMWGVENMKKNRN